MRKIEYLNTQAMLLLYYFVYYVLYTNQLTVDVYTNFNNKGFNIIQNKHSIKYIYLIYITLFFFVSHVS